MKVHSFLKVKKDIQKFLNYEMVRIEDKKPNRILPVFQRINDDVPYLTESKLEDAYLNKEISKKTKKLLEWLSIRENLEVAENIYNNNKNKFEEVTFLLESEKINFTTLVRKLIHKHEQAISCRE
tara:strand:- start:532 stop:906 length:375 start_codon:yes stop_codon:yes gene_type:complete